MTDRLTETELTERLDERGVLDLARGPGCYALQLQTPPDDAHAVSDAWLGQFDARPPRGTFDQLASADRLCYVGSHGASVYERLCQHVRGHQSATIMSIWPPVDVVALWPEQTPVESEWGHAADLAVEDGTHCWTDGELL